VDLPFPRRADPHQTHVDQHLPGLGSRRRRVVAVGPFEATAPLGEDLGGAALHDIRRDVPPDPVGQFGGPRIDADGRHEPLQPEQREVARRTGARERQVGELVVGVDGQRTLRPQLYVEPEAVPEPVALAVPIASPPLRLLVGEVAGGQHR